METIKGYIVSTIQEYEVKQNEIALSMGIVKQNEIALSMGITNQRYAGRFVDGVTFPDIQLNDNSYFIPYEEGVDSISKSDIKVLDI
tara:strand:+ start:162 stop:422 length:261 start_codon:yes stop_codon:yes gene_type:complete